jgi:hypothetical protein
VAHLPPLPAGLLEPPAKPISFGGEAIYHMLQIVGFRDALQRIQEEVFPDLRARSIFGKDDLKDTVKDFCSRNINNGRITIPQVRMLHMLGMIRWVQDSYRCSEDPVVKAFDDNPIESVNQRALICKELKAQATAVAKSAEPKKLKGEKDWYEWFDSLTNYLSLLLDSHGVTLDYIVRADHHPKLVTLPWRHWFG